MDTLTDAEKAKLVEVLERASHEIESRLYYSRRNFENMVRWFGGKEKREADINELAAEADMIGALCVKLGAKRQTMED